MDDYIAAWFLMIEPELSRAKQEQSFQWMAVFLPTSAISSDEMLLYT